MSHYLPYTTKPDNRNGTCCTQQEFHNVHVWDELVVIRFVFSAFIVLTLVSLFTAIGFNVETVTYKNLKFQVWDLGGQTSIRYVLSSRWCLCCRAPKSECVKVYVEHGRCSKQLVTQLRPWRFSIEIRILWRLHLQFCWLYSSCFYVIWSDDLSLVDRPYWRCYYSNTDAVIYVVDSSDRDRMGISKSELVAMLEVSGLILNFNLKALN